MTGHTASAVGSRDEGEFSSLRFFVHPGTQSMGLSHLLLGLLRNTFRHTQRRISVGLKTSQTDRR